MPGRYGDLDYARLAKGGVAASAGAFAIAALVLAASRVAGVTLPGWEVALLTDVEYLAIVAGVLSAFVFGVALPLTE